MGVPTKWMGFVRENPNLKRMINRATPILGHHHLVHQGFYKPSQGTAKWDASDNEAKIKKHMFSKTSIWKTSHHIRLHQSSGLNVLSHVPMLAHCVPTNATEIQKWSNIGGRIGAQVTEKRDFVACHPGCGPKHLRAETVPMESLGDEGLYCLYQLWSHSQPLAGLCLELNIIERKAIEQ